MRKEVDYMGSILVDDDVYYGAQTKRSLIHFHFSDHYKMSPEMITTLVKIKKCAAIVNHRLGHLDKLFSETIVSICDILVREQSKYEKHFPLSVYQTGSGTQTNMNVNEVIANMANQKLKYPLGGNQPIHPNDHVNMSQSSNDTFTTAMHILILTRIKLLLPTLTKLSNTFYKKSIQFKQDKKVGRTHLMDAVPITLGQEMMGYHVTLNKCIQQLKSCIPYLSEIDSGATAVGTGINSDPRFGYEMCKCLAKEFHLCLKNPKTKFDLASNHVVFVYTSGVLKTIASSLYKIVNDIRFMASGPKEGFHQIIIPANEPGSSIMPSKVNPTQCESLLMICIKIIGNDTIITMANSQGNFELNNFKPLIIDSIQSSIYLLDRGCKNFQKFLLEGLRANRKKLRLEVKNNLVKGTSLSPLIGYEKTAQLIRYAEEKNISLDEANKKLKFVSPRKLIQILEN